MSGGFLFPTTKVCNKEKFNKVLQVCWCSLTILHLTGLAKGTSFGSSHCEGLGITQHSHTSIAISLSFKILSSTLNQRTSGVSNSFSLGNLLTNVSDNHSNKVLTTFLFTVEASILSLYLHAEDPY